MTHLCKVNRTYYFRLRIPSDLRSFFGDREYFKRSLHTPDLKNAQTLLNAWRLKAEKTFTLMRSGFMTSDQIRQLAEQFFRETLNDITEDRATGRLRLRNEDEIDEYLDTLAFSTVEFREALACSNLKPVHHVATDLLQKNSLEVDQKSTDFKLLCMELLRQLIRVNEVEQKRAVGDYGDLPVIIPDAPHQQESITAPAPPVKNSPLLSTQIDKYIEDLQREGRANANSLKEYEGSCKLFLRIVGDIPVTTLTRDDLRDYHDKLKKLPPHINKKKEYRDKTIDEILGMGVKETLGDAAIQKHIIVIKALIGWLVRNEVIEKNVSDVLRPPQKKGKAHEQRKAFDQEDLKKLVDGLLEAATQGMLVGRPERFWVPLIGLFTGARLNEICQLHTGDIEKVDDVWCFKIDEAEDEEGNEIKRTKNTASIRAVPIHHTLIDLGILDYHQKIVKAGEPRLWMKLSRDDRGKYNKNFSNWFLGTTNCQGFLRAYVTEDKQKNFHSFRHTFINTLKQLEVQEVTISELVGHANDSITTGRYGKPFAPVALLEKLKLVDYGVDLSPLKEVAASLS